MYSYSLYRNVCFAVANGKTEPISVQLFTLPERYAFVGVFMDISKSGLKGISL